MNGQSLGFPFLWPPTQFLVGQSVLQLPQFQMVLFIVDYVSLLESNPVISCVTLFPRRHQQTFFMPHTENQQQTKAELGEPMSFTVVTCRSRNDTKKNCVPKAHPSVDDSSLKLGTWSILHSLQSTRQVGWRVLLGPGLTWSEPFPGSSAGL